MTPNFFKILWRHFLSKKWSGHSLKEMGANRSWKFFSVLYCTFISHTLLCICDIQYPNFVDVRQSINIFTTIFLLKKSKNGLIRKNGIVIKRNIVHVSINRSYLVQFTEYGSYECWNSVLSDDERLLAVIPGVIYSISQTKYLPPFLILPKFLPHSVNQIMQLRFTVTRTKYYPVLFK